jgi:hypothetical protein
MNNIIQIDDNNTQKFQLNINQIKEIKAKMFLTFLNTSVFGTVISIGCLHERVLKLDIKTLSKLNKMAFIFRNTSCLAIISVLNNGLKFYNNLKYENSLNIQSKQLESIREEEISNKDSLEKNKNKIKLNIFCTDLMVRLPIYTLTTLFYYRKNKIPLLDRTSAIYFLIILITTDFIELYRL